MTVFEQWMPAQASPEVVVNGNFEILAYSAIYAKDPSTSSGLTWGYIGGRWSGAAVAAGVLTLAASTVNYVVVAKASGIISSSASDANWRNTASYVRVYRITTGPLTVTAVEDWRAGGNGLFGPSDVSGGSTTSISAIPIACSDEETPLTVGTKKVTFRMPYGMSLASVRASLTNPQVSGALLTVDINLDGVSILSTKLTVDNGETTSTTAAAPAVISVGALTDDGVITVDLDQVGDGTATGLKVYLIGVAE